MLKILVVDGAKSNFAESGFQCGSRREVSDDLFHFCGDLLAINCLTWKSFRFKREYALVYQSFKGSVQVLRTRGIQCYSWLECELPPEVRKGYQLGADAVGDGCNGLIDDLLSICYRGGQQKDQK